MVGWSICLGFGDVQGAPVFVSSFGEAVLCLDDGWMVELS